MLANRSKAVDIVAVNVSIVLLGVSVTLFYLYGDIDWNQMGEPSGDYSVGAKTMWTQRNSQHTLVLFPIKKRSGGVAPGQHVSYAVFGDTFKRHATRYLQWWARGVASVEGKDEEEFGMSHFFDHIRPEHIWNEAKYDLPLDNDKYRKLTPIIFMHGLGSNNRQYLGLYRELASHGFIVFAIDSHDGSCRYTETAEGSAVVFDVSSEAFDFATRNK